MYTQRELEVGRRRSFEEGSSVVAFAAAAAVAANRFLLFIRSVCVLKLFRRSLGSADN